jgi:hypothetical protein
MEQPIPFAGGKIRPSTLVGAANLATAVAHLHRAMGFALAGQALDAAEHARAADVELQAYVFARNPMQEPANGIT